MSTISDRSVRRKTIPESGGPGRRVMRTFLPVCKPTPVARIEFLSVRCPTILSNCYRLLHPGHSAAAIQHCARESVIKSALPYHRRKSDTNAFPLTSTPPPISSGVQNIQRPTNVDADVSRPDAAEMPEYPANPRLR